MQTLQDDPERTTVSVDLAAGADAVWSRIIPRIIQASLRDVVRTNEIPGVSQVERGAKKMLKADEKTIATPPKYLGK